ncbi:hypothetical protein DFH08DRAFT_1022449 [Mycena albidolilacea]|uniref:Uncharacterized protein n=1 Tax=Mycena albidolilacea TaxID=1033008 RepID=A0AAD7EKN6_9AGAR|nr:hypothetical protein DFH08DRAFT_1022449 [Mycena albidolilacea]
MAHHTSIQLYSHTVYENTIKIVDKKIRKFRVGTALVFTDYVLDFLSFDLVFQPTWSFSRHDPPPSPFDFYNAHWDFLPALAGWMHDRLNLERNGLVSEEDTPSSPSPTTTERLQPSHQLALKTLRKDAFGGMLTFHVEGGFKHVKKVINSLKLSSHLSNLGAFRSFGLKPLGKTRLVHGDAKTLVIAPFITIQSRLTPQERELTGVTEDTIWHDLPLYSVGIEGAANIIEPIRNSQTGMRNWRLVLCAIHVLLADLAAEMGLRPWLFTSLLCNDTRLKRQATR